MIYGLIFTHWIADFIAQTDDMAKNKSKSNVWLGKHILAYMAVLVPFAIAAGWTIPGKYWMAFVLINGAAHFGIDYVTSRVNSRLWQAGKVHEFFVGVGFDQALHMATLIATYQYLLAR
jgi:hypothetical protein